MKCTNARELDRKSGVRWSERGAPVQFFGVIYEVEGCRFGAVVSHISRKTSEMWGTLRFVAGLEPRFLWPGYWGRILCRTEDFQPSMAGLYRLTISTQDCVLG
jgi:hypothetical protein